MTSQYFAVIDTNVLVSAALKWQSVPGSIVHLAFDGIIAPFVVTPKQMLSIVVGGMSNSG